MASLMLAFSLSLLLIWETVSGQKPSSSDRQERSFVSAHAGEDLTLQCLYNTQLPARLYWYKQILGQRPDFILSFDTKDKNSFHTEIKKYPRFKMDKGDGKALLTITDLHISDSATYHCIYFYYQKHNFSESVTVSVKDFGSSVNALVHQSVSEINQPQGFVTLSCTVNAGSCDGKHSVYWYKNSEESPPVLFYTHDGMNDQCDTQSNTCFYELPMNNLTDAGMYYCAVASCGQVQFGNGIKIDLPNKGNPWVLVYLLSGALTFTIIFNILLAFSLYNIIKKNSSQTSGAQGLSSPSTANAEEMDSLHYAALGLNRSNRPRRQRTTINNECVYSSVNA